MKTKHCPVCDQILVVTEFGKNKARQDGLQSKCKSCDRAYKKDKYLANCEVYKDRAKQRRSEINEWFDIYKQTLVCVKCKDNRWYVLDFHHKDPSQKEGSVSFMAHYGYSKERILEEVAKYDVLCSNCHRELHHLMRAQ